MKKYFAVNQIICIFVYQIRQIKNKKQRVMRTQFVEEESRYQAKKQCPWASRTAKVCGGFMCFESVDDYKTWKNQK